MTRGSQQNSSLEVRFREVLIRCLKATKVVEAQGRVQDMAAFPQCIGLFVVVFCTCLIAYAPGGVGRQNTAQTPTALRWRASSLPLHSRLTPSVPCIFIRISVHSGSSRQHRQVLTLHSGCLKLAGWIAECLPWFLP